MDGSKSEAIDAHTSENQITGKSIKLRKKHKKKNKKRKRSNPQVTNISYLLSTNLSLISPQANANADQVSALENTNSLISQNSKSECLDSTVEIIDLIGVNDIKSQNNKISKTEVMSESETCRIDLKVQSRNAFEFMMESRNRSIGRNSPGKEIDKDSNANTPDNKNKLIARKLLFEKWATDKESKKYKIDETERVIYIKEQLQKRAKKLKKLLSIEEKQKHKKDSIFISDSEDRQLQKKAKKLKKMLSVEERRNNKKAKVIISDSEDSQHQYIKTSNSNANEILKSIDTTLNSNKNMKDESKNNPSRSTNNLHNFLSISKPEKRKFVEDDSFEFDQTNNSNKQDLIKFKMFSPAVFKRTKKVNNNGIGVLESDNVNKYRTYENHESGDLVKIKIKENQVSRKDNSCNNFEALKIQSLKCPKPSSSNMKSKVEKIPVCLSSVNTKFEATGVIEGELGDNQKEIMKITVNETKNRLKKSKKNRLAMRTDAVASKPNRTEYYAKKRESVMLTTKNTSSKSSNIEEQNSNDYVQIIENALEMDENEPLRRSLRNRKTRTYNDFTDICLVYSDDSEDEKYKRKASKAVKIAPIFLQNKIKPKVDPEVLEARRKFLMSGIPEALKKSVEKQQSLDDIETDFFPAISHIQQKYTTKDDMDYWNLPEVKLPIVNLRIPLPEIIALRKGVLNKYDNTDLLDKFANERNENVVICSPQKIKNLKLVLLEIKKNNPNYPVFKSFRLLKDKFDKMKSKEMQKKENTSSKRKSARKNKTDSRVDLNKQQENNHDLSMMWSEKYKANKYEDLIGNYSSTSEIKKWLEDWLDISENKLRTLKCLDSSSSEFDIDSESQDSMLCPRNAIVLAGPHGSGKTMTIYALCNELGINVLELNASSKRTGKRLLQEMQEATQSHQVRKNETLDLDTFFKSHENGKRKKEPPGKPPKMCLLLVEDVDIVFEQDEGFLSALSQLLTTSKRPIILTAADVSSPTLQKVIGQNSIIQFCSLKPKIIAVWLQIICLLEGYFINNESLCELLEWNMGDVRKTLLQLQFWAESGGGVSTETPLHVITNLNKTSEESILNDDTHLSFEETQGNESITVSVHSKCVSSFSDQNDINLEKVWWNMPQYYNTKADSNHLNDNASLEESKSSMTDLHNFCNYFDSISEIDKSHVKCGIMQNSNLTSKNAFLHVKDSTELSEVYCNYNARLDFVKEWSNCLLRGHMTGCQNSEKIALDMGLPNSEGRRWENKQQGCKDKFREVVPFSYHIDRRALSLDYFPSLRTIARSEVERSVNNQKRRNRFINYFRTLGIRCSETVLKTACNVLDHKDCEKR